MVQGRLRLWRRSASHAAGRRTEPSRGSKADDGSAQAPPTHRGQVDPTRKVRRAQSTQMRDPRRASISPCPRTRIRLSSYHANASLGDSGADAPARRRRPRQAQAVRRGAKDVRQRQQQQQSRGILGRLVFGAAGRRRVSALHRVSRTYARVSKSEANYTRPAADDVFFFFFSCQKDPDALLDPEEKVPIPREEAAKRACAAFEAVFANGHQVELDHYIVYNARKQPFTFERIVSAQLTSIRAYPLALPIPNRLRVRAIARVHG